MPLNVFNSNKTVDQIFFDKNGNPVVKKSNYIVYSYNEETNKERNKKENEILHGKQKRISIKKKKRISLKKIKKDPIAEEIQKQFNACEGCDIHNTLPENDNKIFIYSTEEMYEKNLNYKIKK